MKTSKYSVLLIPDTGEKKYQFTVKRFVITFGLTLFTVLLLVSLFGIYFTVKTQSTYLELQEKYDLLVNDRTKVMEFLSDVQRMKQMNELIRTTLGTEIEGTAMNDESIDSLAEREFQVSYVENIPSVAPIEGWLTQKTSASSVFSEENHYGIDLAVKEGEPVVASASGYVVYSGWNYELGNLIILYHGDDYFTLYGHNQSNLVGELDRVHHGEVIAFAGKTGLSSGPHLHYEIWKDGETLDPLMFFPQYLEKDVSPKHE